MGTTDTNGIGAETPLEVNAQLVDGFLSENLAATLEQLRQQAWQTDGTTMPEATYERLKRLRQIRAALAALMTQSKVEDARHFVYLISAAFLRDAFYALTKTRDENLVYATGPDDGTRLCALTRLVTFNLAQRSVAQAVPEQSSQLAALSQLDKNEERLLATLHSHSGIGARSTMPSPTDRSTQQGLERNGYPAIGAIFSRDGYVRFYSVNRLFRVAVSGAGARQIDDYLFQITDIKPRPRLAVKALDPRTLVRTIDSRAKTFFQRRSQ